MPTRLQYGPAVVADGPAVRPEFEALGRDQTVRVPDPDVVMRSGQEIRDSEDAGRCGGRKNPLYRNSATVRRFVASETNIREMISELLTA